MHALELRDNETDLLVLAFPAVPEEVDVDDDTEDTSVKGEVKAKIKISPVVVFGVLSRMVLVREC